MYNNEKQRKVLGVKSVCAVIYGIALFCVGLILLWVSWSPVQQNERFIARADSVVGVCTESFSNRGMIEVSYLYNGRVYRDIVIDDYGQYISKDEQITLFVNPNNPSQCVLEYKTDEGEVSTYIDLARFMLVMGGFLFFIGLSRIRNGVLR